MKLNLLVLRTPRLEDLRRFYSALGVHFERERHGDGPEHYAATFADGLVLELYPALDGSTPDAGLRLGLSVDDIGKTLRSLGETVIPRQTQWGLRALVRDPDGRTVEVVQFQTACAVPPREAGTDVPVANDDVVIGRTFEKSNVGQGEGAVSEAEDG